MKAQIACKRNCVHLLYERAAREQAVFFLSNKLRKRFLGVDMTDQKNAFSACIPPQNYLILTPKVSLENFTVGRPKIEIAVVI